MESVFQGLRVLDLSSVLAGPSVASFFAELGATVIKVENPRTNGDVTRSWKLPSETHDSTISAISHRSTTARNTDGLTLHN
jgi:crotonobetainyl-CoA:carnitine CoA-transferase CaiB-like acyl-CoA transferase